MWDFRYYKKSKEIKQSTENKIKDINISIKQANLISNCFETSYHICIEMTKNTMGDYIKSLNCILPMKSILKVPNIQYEQIENISEIKNKQKFNKNQKRNDFLWFLFGKAEYFDSQSNDYDIKADISKKNVELNEKSLKDMDLNEKINIINYLRNLLIDNINLISHFSRKNMGEKQLFYIYSGIKIFETLYNIIGGNSYEK